jgi:DNA-binding transcriptional ArsR family regulator
MPEVTALSDDRFDIYAAVDLASPLRALGEPSRLWILALLKEREMTISELTSRLDVGQPTVSYHVRQLAAAGLVKIRRGQARGPIRATFCSLDRQGLAALSAAIAP